MFSISFAVRFITATRDRAAIGKISLAEISRGGSLPKNFITTGLSPVSYIINWNYFMHNTHPTAQEFGGISLYLSLPPHIPPKTSSLTPSCMFPLGCVNPEAWPVSTAGPHAKPSVMTSRLALLKVLVLIHFNLHHRKMIVCVCEGVCSGSVQHMEVAHGFVMKMENPPMRPPVECLFIQP